MSKSKINDHCGCFGIRGCGQPLAHLSYYALYALQHRGQESSGIFVQNNEGYRIHKDLGVAGDVFNDAILDSLDSIQPTMALAHARYGIEGTITVEHSQPQVYECAKGLISIGYNGQLLNGDEIKKAMMAKGSIFQNVGDTELMSTMIGSADNEDLKDSIVKMMNSLNGAYSVVMSVNDKLIGMKDPHGVRPLCIGKKGDAYILSSESCAIHAIGGELIREVKNGEIIIIDDDGIHEYMCENQKQEHFCVFEFVYIARPDSVIYGETVATVRRRMGAALARRANVSADAVVPVPDSGICAALGYADEAGLPFLGDGLLKNRYIGRTFIQPKQSLRELSVSLKLSPVRENIAGKSIVLVDDSIVRGTTSKLIVKMLREAGVKEVHMALSCPPVTCPCYYGIDISHKKDLLATSHTIEQMKEYIGVDSLHFLDYNDMKEACGFPDDSLCAACFDGKYIMK